METIDKIKRKIRILIQSELPDWNRINKLCDAAIFLEDNEGGNYTDRPSHDYLAENDIEMAGNGYKFDKGSLDWYLDSNEISPSNKKEIKAIKAAQGV